MQHVNHTIGKALIMKPATPANSRYDLRNAGRVFDNTRPNNPRHSGRMDIF